MQEKPKRKRGQPTKYKPEYCEMLIAHRKEGLSFETFAAITQTDVDTIYNWVKLFPDFSEAKRKSDALCRLWWEKVGVGGTVGKIPGFAASTWVFNMKARWGWRDGSEVSRSTGSKNDITYETEWGSKSEPTDKEQDDE